MILLQKNKDEKLMSLMSKSKLKKNNSINCKRIEYRAFRKKEEDTLVKRKKRKVMVRLTKVGL